MKKLGDLLRYYITRSGHTIYSIAKAADIKRPTIQKIISSGQRPSKELIDQLLPFLKLSPAEKDELLTVVDIMLEGEDIYEQRLYIKELLEKVSDFLYSNHGGKSINTSVSASSANESRLSALSDMTYMYGSFAIENLICRLIEQECSQEHPKVRLNIPAIESIIHRIFSHTIFSCPDYSHLEILHIINLIDLTDEKNPCLDMENLKIFSNILPFIAFSDFPYHVYYYYDSQHRPDIGHMAFPYYITGTGWCVLLSSHCDACIFSGSKELPAYIHDQFDAEMNRTVPLACVCRNPEDILSTLLQTNAQDLPLFYMAYQPCFTAYLTDDLLRRYSRPEIPHYEENFSLVINRARQLRQLHTHSCVFSKAGLIHFMETGYLDDYPENYVYPLNPEDRLYMLDQLYQDIANYETHRHRMVNPCVFMISEHFSYFTTGNDVLIFFGYNHNRADYNYIIIKEPRLIRAFVDFSNSMLLPSLVYPKEDTLAFIRECMDTLKKQLS